MSVAHSIRFVSFQIISDDLETLYLSFCEELGLNSAHVSFFFLLGEIRWTYLTTTNLKTPAHWEILMKIV